MKTINACDKLMTKRNVYPQENYLTENIYKPMKYINVYDKYACLREIK